MATDGVFGPDGTQDPPPLPVFPDPLSGLVAGELSVAESWSATDDSQRPRVTPPTSPDPDAIAAVLAAEAARRPPPRSRQGAPRTRPPSYPTGPASAALPRNGRSSSGCAGCLVALVILAVILFAVFGNIAEFFAGLFR